jgi:tRNA(Ile)-lysidine synthase TilS/MesJ
VSELTHLGEPVIHETRLYCSRVPIGVVFDGSQLCRSAERTEIRCNFHHGLKSVEGYDGPKELRMAESQRKSERATLNGALAQVSRDFVEEQLMTHREFNNHSSALASYLIAPRI